MSSIPEFNLEVCDCRIGCDFCDMSAAYLPKRYVLGDGKITHVVPERALLVLDEIEEWLTTKERKAMSDVISQINPITFA